MYTSLPLLNLKDDLKKAFEEAWDFAAEELNVDVEQVILQWNGSKDSVFTKSTARNVRLKSALTFTLEELVELVNWLIDNTYISNGGQCRRQRQGMPMGTNYAPPICDLFLYVHESSHIDQLLLEDKVEEAKAYHLTFRLIDDVLSIDNPFYEDLVKSYPSYLTAEETSLPDGANFIGMSIRPGPNNQIELGFYDKRKDFPFKVVRYPNLANEIPTNIPYGLFIGQLYRFCRICSAIIGAVVEAVSLALTLFKQGAKILRLLQCFTGLCVNVVNVNTGQRLCSRALRERVALDRS